MYICRITISDHLSGYFALFPLNLAESCQEAGGCGLHPLGRRARAPCALCPASWLGSEGSAAKKEPIMRLASLGCLVVSVLCLVVQPASAALTVNGLPDGV